MMNMEQEMKTEKLDSFTRAYIEAALWSSTDENDEPLDANFTFEDLSENAIYTMRVDCEHFQELHGIPEYNDSRWFSDSEKAGHDFWLTRNRHGVGFWGRSELDKETQKRLTDAAHTYREQNLYVGEDGKIHVF
jgi:hypothetical protein